MTEGKGTRRKTVGKYAIERELGRGAMGVVFLATDRESRRTVALKVLIDPSERWIARFEREGRTLARLDHPSIVRVFEVGNEGGVHYLAMEYLAGVSLRDAIPEGGMDPELAAHIVQQLARALQVAHDAGVVHRDIKPSNVIIDELGNAFLTDFGIAKETASRAQLTLDPSRVGTPAYMAPEQIEGEEVDGRSDVYSLGVLMYQALTGVPPFRGPDPMSLFSQILTSEPEPPSKVRPALPEDLEAICMRAIAKTRSSRYQSAGEMADDLEAFFTGKGVGGVRRRRAAPSVSLKWLARGGFAVAALLVAADFHGSLTSVPAPRLAIQERSGVHFEKARAALRQDRWLEAANLARRALFLVEDHGGARKILDDARARRDVWAAERLHHAGRLARSGKLLQAVSVLEGVLALIPGHGEAAQRMAELVKSEEGSVAGPALVLKE